MKIEELMKELDEELTVNEIKKVDKTIYITCERGKQNCKCPYCNEVSESIHSKYTRTIGDLPILNNEVKLLLTVKKFFCSNPECHHKTFGERFTFVEPNEVRTTRLNKYINHMGLRDNSMDTVRNLKEAGIKVSSNTVLRIVKKNKNNCSLSSKEYRNR